MEQRVCYRCLIRDLAREDYEQRIGKYLAAIRDRVSEEQYEERLNRCKQCDKLNEGTCGACGCYVELRAASASGTCPYKRW